MYQSFCLFKKFFVVIFCFDEVLFLFLVVLEIGCFEDVLPLFVLVVVFDFLTVVFLSDFTGVVVGGGCGVSVIGLVLFCFFSGSLSDVNNGVRSSYKSAMTKHLHSLKEGEIEKTKRNEKETLKKYV